MLAFASTLSSRCQKESSAPSPPVLPSSQNSPQLEKLLHRVQGEAEIRGFTITFGRPLDKDSRYLGRTTYLYNKIDIQIRAGVSGELRETALAHELLHAEMRTQGFASTYRDFPNSEFLSLLSETILDCVNHQIIDPRLRASGFNPRLIWQGLIEDAEGPFRSPVDLNDTGFQRLNGLMIYCLSLHVDKKAVSDVERAMNKAQPKIVAYERQLRKRFGDLPCDDPDTCFQQTKRLRDELGYPDVKFGNPKTNLAE